jgi:hypothetical protein
MLNPESSRLNTGSLEISQIEPSHFAPRYQGFHDAGDLLPVTWSQLSVDNRNERRE